jgi:hypothetical protein
MTVFKEGNTVISTRSSSSVITTVIILYTCCMTQCKGSLKCECDVLIAKYLVNGDAIIVYIFSEVRNSSKLKTT